MDTNKVFITGFAGMVGSHLADYLFENTNLEKHVKTRSTWIRLIFMIICSLLYALSRLVTFAVVVVQFLTVLLTGETNTQLKQWGRSLAVYSFEVVDFLTFNTEVKPFPFEAEWPSELPTANAPSEDDE